MHWFEQKRIYLDHASATPLAREVSSAPQEGEAFFANPGGIHADSVQARKKLESARGEIARELGCKPREVVCTSGLTESNNLAILGFARKLLLTGDSLAKTHWVVSAIEHDSVLECFGEVERLGGKVSFVNPDERGIISPEYVERTLRPETVFVSIGWANNEIGVVQPLRAIAQVLQARSGAKPIVFHSDAGQGPLYLFPHVHTLGVDLFALGGGKLYGPRTAGVLYVGKPDVLAPVLLGGSQEMGLRAGTEHLVPVVGFARALEIISKERKEEGARLQELRDMLARELSSRIPNLVVNGDLKHVLPHMLNVSIPDVSAEYVVLALDRDGISISTKSACREGESSSHVVAALSDAASKAHAEESEWRARNTLRFSLGRGTTRNDIMRAAESLERIVQSYPHFAKSPDK